MKNTRICTVLSVSVLLLCRSVGAYNAEHGPFAPGAMPALFPMQACDRTEVASSGEKYPKTVLFKAPDSIQGAGNLVVQVEVNAGGQGAAVTVMNKADKALWGPHAVDTDLEWGDVVVARCADMNRDGRPDFVVYFWCGGCGLASGYTDLLFLISEAGGYRGTMVTTLTWGEPWVFVDLEGNGACQLIHTSFIYGEPGRDGKAHNYWVYNVLQVEGGRLRVANEAHPGFPRWVWYTFTPNHRETRQLATEQKARLWRDQGELRLRNVAAIIVGTSSGEP
ncbi:MAG: hypothetical protein K8T26_11455 [Lentisphaerae bacterium]|nr:hypothetical protein [Lentisphaerota bacterium]